MNNTKFLILVILGMVLMSLQSCEKEGELFLGRIIVAITDDPFPIEIIEEASIRVFRFEAHPVNSEEDNDMILLSDDTVTYNLVKLRNGVTETLVNTEIEAGKYDYFRLFVDEAYLTIIDGISYSVKVPSGSTSGIKVKIDPSVLVEEGLTTELLLDIDLSKSFVLQGNYRTPAGIKGFNFKPVIRAINISEAGRLEGFVKDVDSNPINGVSITMEYDSDSYSTFSDSIGYYSMIGLPTGIYTLTADGAGYDILDMKDVVIVAGNKTTRNLTLLK